MAQTPRRVLLVQFRDAADAMAGHERACIARRLGGYPLTLTSRNALAETASRRWLDGMDGLIIGGSGAYSCHHAESRPWVDPARELLERVIVDGTPAFGLCFGHQLLGHHLGAEVRTSEARTEIGTVALQLTERGAEDPVFSYLGPTFQAQTGHSDHVSEVSAELEVLVGNARVPLQAFKLRDKPVYTTQFHPDMTGAEARDRYLAYQGHLGGEGDADVFKVGTDVSAGLLGRFFAHALLD